MKITAKTKKKLFFMGFIFCILFIGSGIFNYAMQNYAVKNIPSDISITENQYIYDNANCLSEYSKTFLENKAKDFYNKNNCKIFFITTESVHGENIHQTAKAIRTNFDATSENKTTLILLSKETAEITLAGGPAVEKIITEEYIYELKNKYLLIDDTSPTYSDSLQKLVMQVFDDILAEKESIDEYGKIFVKSNKDTLIICGFCAIIFMVVAFFLLKNGKAIQKAIDDEKEQERLDFLENKKLEDALIEQQASPSPSPTNLFPDDTLTKESSPSETDMDKLLKEAVLSSQSISSKISSDIN